MDHNLAQKGPIARRQQKEQEHMKVTNIKATIKCSREITPGTWRHVELGAEAQVEQSDFWQEALELLHHDLTDELRAAWGTNKPHDAAAPAPPSPAVPPPPAPATPSTQAAPAPPPDLEPPTCPTHATSRPSTKYLGWYCPAQDPDDGTFCRWQHPPKAKKRHQPAK